MKVKYGIVFTVLLTLVVFSSCQTTTYYFHETPSRTYTELQLNKDGTFKEYIYLSVRDSLIQNDFGNVISGTYSYKSDTLLLKYDNYSGVESTNATDRAEEVFIKDGKNLIKLAPITYSHHFLNMTFLSGKSKGLRSLEQYDAINWKTGI